MLATLRKERLVTLTGPPGVGKTRLTVEIAFAAPGDHGTWWVDLATVMDPDAVVSAFARSFGVHEQPLTAPSDALTSFLAGRRSLVVVDNCEHVADAASTVIRALLEAAPELKVLATSRHHLGIDGEWNWEVPPLSLPTGGTSAGDIAATEAVQLFRARASAVDPGFDLDPETVPAVAEICCQLDGIPLAIELAAARASVLSATEIAARLGDRFSLLGSAPRSLRARHETLMEAMHWSYALLGNAQQALLRRLGVFAGSPSFEAVKAICAGQRAGTGEVLDQLSELVASSLVVARTSPAPARYHLLETVRAYAIHQLAASGETDEVVARHTRWYLDVAETAEPHLTGADQQHWLSVLDAHEPDLHAALSSALERGDGETALRLGSALALYWRLRGRFSEGFRYLELARLQTRRAAADVRAKGAWAAGFMALMAGDAWQAEPLLTESLALWRRIGDVGGQARACLLLGNFNLGYHGKSEGIDLLHRSAVLAREAADPWCQSHALALAGLALLDQGDIEGSRAALEESIAVARAAGEIQGLRIGLTVLGDLELAQGCYRKAQSLLEEALRVCTELGDLYGVAGALSSLGTLAASEGQGARARQLLDEGLAVSRACWSPDLVASILTSLARLALSDGDFDEAGRLVEGAQAAVGSTQEVLLALGELGLAQGDTDAARIALQKAVQTSRSFGGQLGAARALRQLAVLDRGQGRPAKAETEQRQALELAESIGGVPDLIASIEALGAAAADAGRFERAARLLAAAHFHRLAGDHRRQASQQQAFEADLATVRSSLAPKDFEAAWAGGSALSIPEVVTYALEGRGRREGKPSSGWESLTRSERDVVALVAEGLTNGQVAERLFVSRNTVKGYLASAFSKLGLTSRVELTRDYMRRHPQDPESGPEPDWSH